jgi:NADPH:quinone reductase-like Zn-dependent oxidoreductase
LRHRSRRRRHAEPILQVPAFGGKVVLIGLLTGGGAGEINPYTLMPKWGSLHGIFVGNREMFESMNKAIVAGRVRPVVGREFPFAEALQAYRCQASGDFFSKVVIRVQA